MITNLIFFAIGAIVSWSIAFYYYKRSSKETPKWFSVENLKEILVKNPSDIDWTARQIVQLYNEKVFDYHSSDPLPYTCCPRCGSEDLEKSSHQDYERDEFYYVIGCKECEWSDYI